MDRRQQNKQLLRARLVHAALRLFAEHGYDRVTVEQIAAGVGVSSVTVFRHFGTKADIVFDPRRRALEQLLSLAHRSPGFEDPRRDVMWVLREFASTPRNEDEELYALRSAIVAGSPELQRASLAIRVEFEERLAAVLEAKPLPGRGWRTRVAAASGLAAFHLGVRQWRDAAGARTLPEVVDEILDDLWPDVSAPA